MSTRLLRPDRSTGRSRWPARLRVVAAVLGALLVSTVAGACRSGDDGTYELQAVFERGISLYEGGDVRVLGLPAGEITSVEVEGAHVRVTMAVRDEIPVPADVQATIVPLSLIGERYVQLFPAWTDGQPKVSDGEEIPLARTSIPVEPDEALEALKEFLDALDPGATGRLVENLADDLEGNGERLNRAVGGLATLATDLAAKDQELVAIIENFDEFTATLRTREQQLGEVMDLFAQTASLLAEERRNVDRLVRALGQVAGDGLGLVSEHSTRLEADLEVITRTLLSVSVHLDSVAQLLDAGPLLVAGSKGDGSDGLVGAWDEKYHHLDLRSAVSPTVSQLFLALGIPAPVACIPVDVTCTPNPQAADGASPEAVASGAGRPGAPGAAAGPGTPSTPPARAAADPVGERSAGRVRLFDTEPWRPQGSVTGPPTRGGLAGFLRRLAEVVA